MKILLALTALLTFAAGSLWAACTTPAGESGHIIFNTTTKTLQYCNGTDWVNTGLSEPSAVQTGCTSPAAAAGAVVYNATQGVVQFCNGTNWIDTACADDRDTSGTGCGSSPTGALRYETTSNELQFCDSTNWVAMGWGCAGVPTPAIDWTTLAQTQKLTATPMVANAGFGFSVAVDGDTMVIGAYGETGGGAVYIFTRSGGTWSQQARVVSSDRATNDYFGYSVDIDGDTVIAGANYDDDQGSASGSAYIFKRTGTTWAQEAKLLPPSSGATNYFGNSVALSGDTAVVGRRNASPGGAAHVFTRSGTTWTHRATLVGSDTTTSNQFGWAVDIESGTIIIGATGKEKVYVFTGSGATWTEAAQLVKSDAVAANGFSYDIAISNGMVVVGAYADDAVATNAGAAYVFTGSGTTWTARAKLTSPDTAAGDYLGNAVAVKGNAIVLGAYTASSNTGNAYVFSGSGSTWTQAKKLIAGDPYAGGYFGVSVAIGTGEALVGAYTQTTAATAAGATYVFSVSPSLP